MRGWDGTWRVETDLNLLLQLKLGLHSDRRGVRSGIAGEKMEIVTDLLEALLRLPVEPLVLVADFDAARRHTRTHGWKERREERGKERKMGKWRWAGRGKPTRPEKASRSRSCEKIKWDG